MCNLGLCYEYGEGVAEDKTKAAEWYEKAARRGMPRPVQPGLFYDRGVGVAEDAAKAVEWYERAAEQGYPAPSATVLLLRAARA